MRLRPSALLVAAVSAVPAVALADVALADVDLGRSLFTRTWVKGDPRSHGGDGLGPTFNERSCVGCHNQAGVGGAGPLARNVGPESRQTPALYGAGVLDRVPDAVIAAGEPRDPVPDGSNAVSGRVAPALDGGVGRFGWKGEIAHLDTFVARACEAELGLDVPDPADRARAWDLDAAELAALVQFVRVLPPPTRGATAAHRGSEVFAATGCTGCHTRRLGEVEGAFTDLLLHDLGGALQSRSKVSGSIYGTRRVELVATVTTGPATAGEWKTPALWGLRDSGPYLHDGRAPTVEAAILAHGGEARESTRRFAGLTDLQRGELMAFLGAI